MPSQSHSWSQAAKNYEKDFVDPYRSDAKNPLFAALDEIADSGIKTIADLGCGTGPLLRFLSDRFQHVIAVDFADGMLKRARQHAKGCKNISFRKLPLTDLKKLNGSLDAAVAVNSIVMPDIADQEAALSQIYAALKPGGQFLAILPAMDAVHYYTMLLVDRARAQGKPTAAARKNAAHFAEHELYDFAFGQFFYKGLKQHFWQPFEIRYRLKRAGFRKIRIAKVELSWDQFACGQDFENEPPSWDWFASAEKSF